MSQWTQMVCLNVSPIAGVSESVVEVVWQYIGYFTVGKVVRGSILDKDPPHFTVTDIQTQISCLALQSQQVLCHLQQLLSRISWRTGVLFVRTILSRQFDWLQSRQVFCNKSLILLGRGGGGRSWNNRSRFMTFLSKQDELCRKVHMLFIQFLIGYFFTFL